MSNKVFLYRDSRDEARRCNEIPVWRESYNENVRCAKAIEEAVRKNFDGMHLAESSPKEVTDEFGYDRTFWVLANTVQYKHYDGRFSDDNKRWAETLPVPKDVNNCYFVADSHPAVLEGFINQVRRQYQEIGLYGSSHCYADSGQMDFKGQVLILKPEMLKDKYKTPDYQLFYAESGFGCDPTAIGRKVFGFFLKDDERTHFNRSNFIGLADEEQLPDWARQKLENTRSGHEQDSGFNI